MFFELLQKNENGFSVKKGGEVSYHDPYILKAKTPNGNSFISVELTEEIIRNADCIVIATNHNVFNSKIIKAQAKLIVDLRNVIKNASEKVFKL